MHYSAALDVFDNYHLALSGLAKSRAAQGDTEEAIRLYLQAVVIIPDPVALSSLGDLYAKIGDTARAKTQYDTVEFIANLAKINQQIYNRQLSLFYLDHGLKQKEALNLAIKELELRKDVYGYDALAWALYKNGRYEEAGDAITKAMRLGTIDATLFYHAGMIHNLLGNSKLAMEYLEQTLDINPHFSILHGGIARQTLSQINTLVAPHRENPERSQIWGSPHRTPRIR